MFANVGQDFTKPVQTLPGVTRIASGIPFSETDAPNVIFRRCFHNRGAVSQEQCI